MSFDLIVRGGDVVTPAGVARADVGVSDGAIAAVEPELTGGASTEIDAAGLHVLPGGGSRILRHDGPGAERRAQHRHRDAERARPLEQVAPAHPALQVLIHEPSSEIPFACVPVSHAASLQ